MRLADKVVYLDSEEKIKSFYDAVKNESILAVDVEAENNYHHYGYYVSLIQIFGNKTAYIIDAIKLNPKSLSLVFELLKDKGIEKVLHDVNFDFRILRYQYDVLPRNIFDTKVAAEILNEKKVGLKDLLYKYFKVVKQKKLQKADWSKRPLSREKIEYAALDVIYLIELRNLLKKKLIEKKLWDTAKQRFAQLEGKDYMLKRQTYLDVKGVRFLSDEQLSFFKDLFELRDNLAHMINRPPFYIMSNKKMLEIVRTPITNLSEWQSLKGVHPIVRKMAKKFYLISKKHAKG